MPIIYTAKPVYQPYQNGYKATLQLFLGCADRGHRGNGHAVMRPGQADVDDLALAVHCCCFVQKLGIVALAGSTLPFQRRQYLESGSASVPGF